MSQLWFSSSNPWNPHRAASLLLASWQGAGGQPMGIPCSLRQCRWPTWPWTPSWLPSTWRRTGAWHWHGCALAWHCLLWCDAYMQKHKDLGISAPRKNMLWRRLRGIWHRLRGIWRRLRGMWRRLRGIWHWLPDYTLHPYFLVIMCFLSSFKL